MGPHVSLCLFSSSGNLGLPPILSGILSSDCCDVCAQSPMRKRRRSRKVSHAEGAIGRQDENFMTISFEHSAARFLEFSFLLTVAVSNRWAGHLLQLTGSLLSCWLCSSWVLGSPSSRSRKCVQNPVTDWLLHILSTVQGSVLCEVHDISRRVSL